MEYLQVDPAAQFLHPVYGCPSHCPYLATEQLVGEVGAVVVVFVVVPTVVVTVVIVVVEVDGFEAGGMLWS